MKGVVMRRTWKRLLAVGFAGSLIGIACIAPAQAADGKTTVWGAVTCNPGGPFLPVAARNVTVSTDMGYAVDLVPDSIWGTFNTRLPISWLGGTRLRLQVRCELPGYGEYWYDADSGLVFPGGGWPVWGGSYTASPPQ